VDISPQRNDQEEVGDGGGSNAGKELHRSKASSNDMGGPSRNNVNFLRDKRSRIYTKREGERRELLPTRVLPASLWVGRGEDIGEKKSALRVAGEEGG